MQSNGIRPERKELNPNTSIAYFSLGTFLLVVPLLLILLWGSSSCVAGSSTTFYRPFYCASNQLFHISTEFFPFVMIVGGVLVGYRMKMISESLAPPKDEEENDADDLDD